MSFFSRIFAARSSIAAIGLMAILPLGFALGGCSDAPKLPKGEAPSKSTSAEPPPSTSENEPADLPAPPGKPRKVESVPVDRDSLPKSDGASSGSSKGGAQIPKDEEIGTPGGEVTEATPPPPPAPPADKPAAEAEKKPAGDDRGRGLGTTAKPEAPSPSASPPPPPTAQPPVTAADKSKGYDVVPVFFGTDRTVEPNPKRLQFGTDRGHKLQLGRAMITIPDIHKVPNIERPWAIEIPYFKYKVYEETEDPKEHFTMQEISALTKEQMLAYVKERLAKSKSFKDHAFVFVHGFNTSFDTALYRTAQIAYDMKFDGVPFVYSWPSGGKVASYTYDRGSTEQAEPHLTEFLNLVIKESGAKSISLIAHSMGNELLLRVLEQMRPSTPEGVKISQVILAAPDVDRDKFGIIAREITSFAKGVTLYAASNDRALSYSARFWGGVPRAGDVPASGPLIIPGIDTIDVTAVSTDSLGLNHSGYAENKTLLNDIALLIQTGERPPDKRIPILKRVDTASGPFWRYPPLR